MTGIHGEGEMDNIGTRFEIRQYGNELKTHTHAHHQIVLPLQGTLEMDIDGRAGAASGAMAALVTAGARHSFAGGPDGACLIVDIAEPGVTDLGYRGPIWDAAVSKPFLRIDRRLSLLCEFLAGELDCYGDCGLDTLAAGELLVDALGRRMGIEGERFEDRLATALRFIEVHRGENIEVDRVADAAGLSASRLHALFRARLRTSPQRYMTARRLKHAARLLARSERPIAEIALDVGYGDQSAFTRAFTRAYAQSPARFRREARGRESRHKIQ